MTKKCNLYTDGGARGNPGPAAIGGYLQCSKKKIATFSSFIGTATNNQAEYRALLYGLQLAQKHAQSDLSCFLDSELIVMQLQGRYKVKDEQLKQLYSQVKIICSYFDSITFSHISRDKNTRADRLVNEALDGRL